MLAKETVFGYINQSVKYKGFPFLAVKKERDFLMIGGNKLISPDLPIKKSAEDRLNRGAFAKSLAKTISQYSFPSSFVFILKPIITKHVEIICIYLSKL